MLIVGGAESRDVAGRIANEDALTRRRPGQELVQAGLQFGTVDRGCHVLTIQLRTGSAPGGFAVLWLGDERSGSGEGCRTEGATTVGRHDQHRH